MRKFIAGIISLVLAMSFASCDNNDNDGRRKSKKDSESKNASITNSDEPENSDINERSFGTAENNDIDDEELSETEKSQIISKVKNQLEAIYADDYEKYMETFTLSAEDIYKIEVEFEARTNNRETGSYFYSDEYSDDLQDFIDDYYDSCKESFDEVRDEFDKYNISLDFSNLQITGVYNVERYEDFIRCSEITFGFKSNDFEGILEAEIYGFSEELDIVFDDFELGDEAEQDLKTANSNAKAAYNVLSEHLAEMETVGISKDEFIEKVQGEIDCGNVESNDDNLKNIIDDIREFGEAIGIIYIGKYDDSYFVQWKESPDSEIIGQYPSAVHRDDIVTWGEFLS